MKLLLATSYQTPYFFSGGRKKEKKKKKIPTLLAIVKSMRVDIINIETMRVWLQSKRLVVLWERLEIVSTI